MVRTLRGSILAVVCGVMLATAVYLPFAHVRVRPRPLPQVGYCYPLTITEFASRYLLGCEALESTREAPAFPVFERVFQEFGLPAAMRTDNGVPFASAWALYGLSKLAVWWLRLVIRLERITPGHPEQNGRHKRMHLTLKETATRPAAANVFQQQARFDDFVDEYNRERPHQALDMKMPADVYQPSPRVYRGLEDVDYPFHDWSAVVTHCGRICFKGRTINLSHSLPARWWGSNRSRIAFGSSASCTTTWAISMMRRAGWNRSIIRLGRRCYPCLRNKPLPMCPE